MQDIDPKEQQRLDNIYNSITQKHQNPEIEKNLLKLEDAVGNLNNKMMERSKAVCKAEYDDLSNYASLDSFGLDVKPNVDEAKLQASLERFQICFEDKNKETIGKLKEFDNEFQNSSNVIRDCFERIAVNSKAKSDIEIERGWSDCLKKYEEIHNNFTTKYIDSFNKMNI